MGGFNVPAGLSSLVIARKVEQRFGLPGFARLLKLVELVADASTKPASDAALLDWGDVLQALGSQDAAAEFLSYCETAGVLERAGGDRLRLALRGELACLLAPVAEQQAPAASPVLFTREQEWVDWFLADMNCPPYLANDASSRQLFRRWIATNVTVEEADAAMRLAIEAREAPAPVVLHEHLQAVRRAKIERARA